MAARTKRAGMVNRLGFVIASGGKTDFVVGAAIDGTHVSPDGALNDGVEFDLYQSQDDDTIYEAGPVTFSAGSPATLVRGTPYITSEGDDSKADFNATARAVIGAWGPNKLIGVSSQGLLTNAGVLQGLADGDVILNPDDYTTAGEAWLPMITAAGDHETLPTWAYVTSGILGRSLLGAQSTKAAQPILFGTSARGLRSFANQAAAQAISWAATFNNGDPVELRGKTSEGDQALLRYKYDAASTADAAWPEVLQCAPSGSAELTGRLLLVGVSMRTTVGDAAYSVLATDRLLATSATLSAARTWTLPAASAVFPGTRIEFADEALGISSANTLTFARASADTIIFSPAGGTSITLRAPGASIAFVSNGLNAWSIVGGGVGAGPSQWELAGDGTDTVTATAVADDTAANWQVFVNRILQMPSELSFAANGADTDITLGAAITAADSVVVFHF